MNNVLKKLHYPLLDSAQPILNSLCELRNFADNKCLPTQAMVMQQLDEFKRSAAKQRENRIGNAHHLLCIALDEAFAVAIKAQQFDSFLFRYYQASNGDERFFTMLDTWRQAPTDNADLLILAFICLATGFKGKYARQEGGMEALNNTRQQLLRLIDIDEAALAPMHSGKVRKLSYSGKLVIGLLVLTGVMYLGGYYLLGRQVKTLKAQIQAVQ